MTNRSLFASNRGIPTIRNEAGGVAFRMNSEQSLAQMAFTGCFNSTYYVSAELQLDKMLDLCGNCDSQFVAKCAIAAHEMGYMRDSAAFLTAYVHAYAPELLPKIFDRTITSGRMLKKFVQIVRSNVTGRRGFGTRTRNIVRDWLSNRTDSQILYDSIGGAQDVSLEHILRMCHPNPATTERSALYAFLRGAKFDGQKLVQEVRFKNSNGTFTDSTREYALDQLPQKLRDWLLYKNDPSSFESIPKLPIQMVMGLSNLKAGDWENVARHMSFNELRQNLNMLARHGCFESPRLVEYICKKLSNPEEIAKAKVMPYQILATFLNTGPMPQGYGWNASYWSARQSENDKKGGDAASLPKEIRNALELAMEEAIKNVPTIPGAVFVCPDTSGSTGTSITGERYAYGGRNQPPASKVRVVDVAGLITAAVLRRNPMAKALPFSTKVHDVDLDPMGSILGNAAKFVSLGGGGTACSAPLHLLNSINAEGSAVIYISDYESWADNNTTSGTAMLSEWKKFSSRNPKAKLICIDLTPRTNHQVVERPDILRIGGFSDHIFDMMAQFIDGKLGPDHWVGLIKEVQL
jgi:60 kDa SS-A/Ro ribonucleoprotein